MPFKPGDPNINRRGRPKKGHTMTEQIEKALAQKDVQRGYEKITRLQAISEVLTQEALKGNLSAINIILDRIEGRPKQSIEQDIRGKINMPTITLTSEFEEEDENLDT